MEFNQEVKKATSRIYQKISKVLPEIEWSVHAPYIHKINQLKKEMDQLEKVRVEIKKVNPPIDGDVNFVSVVVEE